MADTSRKRSRKSKLVPRECDVYSHDEERDLEEKLKNGFSGKAFKVKNEPTTSTSTCLITEMYTGETFTEKLPIKHVSEPPMQINVKVEVERCNDTNSSSQKTMEIDEAEFWKRNKAKKFELTNGIIVAAADEIKKTSTDIADKILDVAVRNTTGHIVKGALQSCTDLNKDIQIALDIWKEWQTKQFLRDGPLFYKCYICNNAWWYLEDFKQHLKTHSSYRLALESQSQHEINIIAYINQFPTKRDIFVQGKCGRCGKDCISHCKKSYICSGCLRQFHTCLSLGFHISICQNLGCPKTRITCFICRLELPSIQNHDHLITVHSVRSDVPIITRRCQYSTCEYCDDRYINKNTHVCTESTYTRCKHCFRGFPTKFLAEIHLDGYSGQFECPICNEHIEHACMKYEHMLKHSDKYALVIKCVLCTKLCVFLSNTGFLKHMKLIHRNVDSTKPGYFTQIMVPKSCLHMDYYTEETDEIKQEIVTIKTEVESDHEGQLIMDENIQEIPSFHIKSQDVEEIPSFEMKSQSIEDIPSIQIKTEPMEIEQEPEVIIKEEPPDIEEVIETPDYSFSHDIIKQELDNDIDVYEEDIIRLDMSFDVKEEKTENQDDSIEYEEDSEDDYSDYDEESSKRANKKLYRCTKCGFTDVHKNYRIHVTNDCSKSCLATKKFSCSKCGDSFKTLGKYLTHLTLHGFEALKCPECFNTYVSQARFVSHVMSHIKQCFVKIKAFNGDGPYDKAEYQCSRCSAAVESNEFFSHWETHVCKATEDIAFVKGNVETPTVLELLARLHKRTKQCCYCHRTFTRFNECKRHQIQHLLSDAYEHKDQYRELRCQICAAGFSTPEKYRQHMRDHASLPVYRCEMCDKSFSDSSNFTKHKKVHNFQVYVCDLCRKKFQSKTGLEKHIQMHMTTQPIVCELCMKSFFFESSYRKHVKYNHNKESVGYPCVICNIRFGSLKHKWRHMWEVHQERKSNADCPICQKSFRILSEVKAHMKRDHRRAFR